mgnify:CR=1 FL=1
MNNFKSPVALSLDELRTRIRDEFVGWRKIVAEKKIVLE